MVAWEGKHNNHKCTQNPPFILHLFAEHAIMLLGTSLWAFWVSCPGSVCSHLAHKMKRESLGTVQACSVTAKTLMCYQRCGSQIQIAAPHGLLWSIQPSQTTAMGQQSDKKGRQPCVSSGAVLTSCDTLPTNISNLSCLLTKAFVFQWSTKKWMKLSLFPLCFCWKDSGFEVLQHTTFLPEPLYPWQSGQLCLDFLYTPIKYWKFEESSLQGFEETWPVGFSRKRSE